MSDANGFVTEGLGWVRIPRHPVFPRNREGGRCEADARTSRSPWGACRSRHYLWSVGPSSAASALALPHARPCPSLDYGRGYHSGVVAHDGAPGVGDERQAAWDPADDGHQFVFSLYHVVRGGDAPARMPAWLPSCRGLFPPCALVFMRLLLSRRLGIQHAC